MSASIFWFESSQRNCQGGGYGAITIIRGKTATNPREIVRQNTIATKKSMNNKGRVCGVYLSRSRASQAARWLRWRRLSKRLATAWPTEAGAAAEAPPPPSERSAPPASADVSSGGDDDEAESASDRLLQHTKKTTTKRFDENPEIESAQSSSFAGCKKKSSTRNLRPT